MGVGVVKPISLIARSSGRERRSWLNERASEVAGVCDSSEKNSSCEGSFDDFPLTL